MKRKVFFVALFIFLSFQVSAEINNLQCKIQEPADTTARYNNGQMIKVGATWDKEDGVATAPFAATFKVNGAVMGSTSVSEGAAEFSISASALLESANQFSVFVIETSVPNAVPSSDVPAGGSIVIDRTPPSLTLSIISGETVSPQPGFNEVTFQFVSNEALGEAPKFTISPGTWSAPSALSPENAPYIVNQYKITVPANMDNGGYTITAAAKDNTLPVGSQNQGTAQLSFNVDASASGFPTISSSSPKSPSKVQYIQLSGSVPAETGAQKVDVLEAGAIKGTATVAANATDWNIAVGPLTGGEHKFTAQRTDPLGNVSGSSGEFSVIIDMTHPGLPILNPPQTPVKTSQVKVTGTGTIDLLKSNPVKVYLFRESTKIAETIGNTDGTFSFDNVTLVAGRNLLFAQAADTTYDATGSAGNETAYSAPITIVLDQNGPTVIPGGVVIGTGGSTGSGTLLMADSDESPPQRFIPPAGKPFGGSTELIFPLQALQDRYPEGVTVYLVTRKAGQSVPNMEVTQMNLDDRTFRAQIPCGTDEKLTYHFILTDRAGNSTQYPINGEFQLSGSRSETLQMTNQSTFMNEPVADDVWAVDSSGFPPTTRLLSYRRLVVSPELLPVVQKLVEENGFQDLVEIQAQGNSNLPSLFQKDLELLKANRLPKERMDLLLRDLSEKVPLQSLPDPATLADFPHAREVKDAIQFRLLHEKPRQ